MKKFKRKFLVSMMCISLIVPQFINEIAASEVAIVYADESELENQTPPDITENGETQPDNAKEDKTYSEGEGENKPSLEGEGENTTNPEGGGEDTTKPEGTGENTKKSDDDEEGTTKPEDTGDDKLNTDGTKKDGIKTTDIPEGLDSDDENLLGDDINVEELDETTFMKRFLGKMKTFGIATYSDEISPNAPTTAAHGSGSYQLNEVGTDYRFYTEYFVQADTKKSIKSAGVDRRTAIKVYAKAGEIILFGSSVSNSQINENNEYTGSVTGKDIVITTPDGSKVGMDVLAPGEKEERPNGLGYIKTPTQEMNGPMVNYDNENDPDDYYVPLRYEVDKSGVYTFEFHSITGFNPNSASGGYHPSPKKASANWAQGNTAVAAWDITVLGKDTLDTSKWEVKSGRAWADYLALTTGGGEGIQSDLDVHVLTHDGYQYKVDFKAAVPYGFIFFANNTGFMSAVTDEDTHTTTYRPIYHSFYDSSNDLDYMSSAEKIYLHKPDEVDTDTEETYKIFFNAPNEDLNGIEYIRNGRTEKIKTKPKDNVSIEGLTFNGGSYDNIARTGHGGHFTFEADDEAIVTIQLDLRKAILDSESSMSEAYKGSGIVEITTPVTSGPNSIYWDGKDTDGIVIPAGIYGDSNVVLASEVKRGELHFPVIDMEGLIGGLQVKRINGKDADSDSDDLYNLYYNNNPLVYGTIEGKDFSKKVDGTHYALSDGTKTYKPYTDRSATLTKFFTYGADSISTLTKDTKEYLAKKFFNSSYSALVGLPKQIVDAEFDKEQAFHFEPVNTKEFATTMKFNCENYDGGGDRAGIDAWTYYTQGIDSKLISFAIMDTKNRGMVRGQIFYDANVSSSFDTGDYLLPGVKVRLIDSQGKPLVHTESLPCFDKKGHFIYDENGNVKHVDTDVKFEAVTDSTGTYRFTGVPYSSTEATTYYVQVMLTDVQSEVLRYTCTTSMDVKSSLVDKAGNHFLTAEAIGTGCGPDGNAIEKTSDQTKIYQYRYERKSIENNETETVFKKENAQAVTFAGSGSGESSSIVTIKDVNKIGYSSTVPAGNQKDYKIVKSWGDGTHQISDGLIVELWVWNDENVHEENAKEHELSRRTGALIDTQVLNVDSVNPENGWTYTWKNLDDRLQYYVMEYYTKKKSDGEIIYNDRGEARKVLIGGTMPIFSTVPKPSIYDSKGIYGFEVNMGDYPHTIPDPDYPGDSSKRKIPIQKFGDGKIYANALTKKEKLESVDNNARQYDVTYTLTTQDIGGRATNIITLNNSQVYDDRTYYVWLDHQTKLPDLIAQTYVQDNIRNSHAVTLVKDNEHPLEDGFYCIKGLSVSSIDSASENVEGNATSAFRISEDDKQYALFTATNHGNYKTGTGTRTYQVKYVVDASTKEPVSVIADGGKLVLTNNHAIKVEDNSGYIVYSWYMTIHVYDVEPDGVIEYNSYNGPVVLQEALPTGTELTWKLKHDEKNENAVSYTSTDERASGILKNDIIRVPLYKAATDYNMGSCADIVGIAYSKDGIVTDISTLDFADTYESRYGSHDSEIAKVDGKAVAQGSGGFVEVDLNTTRITRINRIQDHANYADITFTPKTIADGREPGITEDVFYYKIIIFAEDNTYQYHSYADIDATEGVVMYTYFTLKSELVEPSDEPEEDEPTDEPEEDDPADEPGDNPSGEPGDNPSDEPGDNPSGGPGDNPSDGPGDNPGDGSGDNPSGESGDNPSAEPDNFFVQTIKSITNTIKTKIGVDEQSDEKLAEDSEEDDRNVKGTRAPRTGDYNNWILWGGLFLLSACALTTVLIIQGNKHKQHHSKKRHSKKRNNRRRHSKRRKTGKKR